MTTIAYKGDTMAADTQSQDGAGLKYTVQKLHVADFISGGPYLTKCRLIVAASGHRDDGIRLFEHVRGLMVSQHIDAVRKVLTNLRLDKDLDIDAGNENSSFMASLYSGDRKQVVYRVGRVFTTLDARGYHAIGSGRDFALMAMRLGKSPKQAVKLAHEFDVNTGPGIQEVNLWPT